MDSLKLGFVFVTAVGTATSHEAPHSEVAIKVEGDYRLVEANGRPNHTTGVFPNVGNPNRIQDQRYRFRLPVQPTRATHPIPARGITFGVALNGVVFDPGTAERWGQLHYEAQGGIDLGLDAHHAHVQPSGAYHYHGQPRGLVAALGGNESRMLLLGYAADGYPIYASRCPRDAADLESPLVGMRSSYRLKKGQRSYGPSGRHDGTFVEDYEFLEGFGELDRCNGRSGPTPEFPKGTYYYVLTPSYPFIPRLFRGLPDLSFSKFQIGAPEPPERLARRGRRGRRGRRAGGPGQGFPPPPPGGQGRGFPHPPRGAEGFPPPPGGQDQIFPPANGEGEGQGFPPRNGQGQGFPPPPRGGQGQGFPPPRGGHGQGFPPPRNGHGQGFPPPRNGQGQGQGFPPPRNGQGQGQGFPPPRNGQGQGQGFPPSPPGGQGQGQGFPPSPPGGQGQGQGFPPPPRNGQGQGQGQGFPPPPRGGQGQGFPPPPRGGQGQGFPPPPRGGQGQGQGFPPPPRGGQGQGQGFPPPGGPPPSDNGVPPQHPELPDDSERELPPESPTPSGRWY